MDEEFLINIVIAGKKYPLTIKRHEEELARAAADPVSYTHLTLPTIA